MFCQTIAVKFWDAKSCLIKLELGQFELVNGLHQQVAVNSYIASSVLILLGRDEDSNTA
jgi:hypothetical protein